MSNEARKGFTFYSSFKEAIDLLNNAADKLAIYEAVANYSLFGIEPEFEATQLELMWKLMRPTLEKARRGYENGLKGKDFGKLGGAPEGNQNARKNNPQNNPQNNRRDRDRGRDRDREGDRGYIGENNIDIIDKKKDKKKSATFVAPSLQDIEEYISENGYNQVDATVFYSYYESIGWKVGKNPMKDWKAAVRTWNSKERKVPQKERTPMTTLAETRNNYRLDSTFGRSGSRVTDI